MTKAILKDSLLLAALGLVVAGCSDIDPGEQNYCDVNPGVGECATIDIDRWWCLDETPPQLPDPQAQPVAFVLPAVDWNTSAPLAGNGLVATLCGGIDPACSQPLNALLGLPTPFEAVTAFNNMPLPPGAAGLGLPQGFRGVIQFDVRPREGRPATEQYITTRYHMGGAAFVSRPDGVMRGAPILMLQRGLAESTVRQSFPLQGTPEQTLNLAALAFGVYDCNGNVVPGARIEIKQNGVTPTGLLPFQLPASFIPVPFQPDAPLVTDVTGQVGYLNVPVGNVQLTAYTTAPGGQEQLIGRAELGAVGGQFSVGVIRPAYFLDADVRGAPEPTSSGSPRGG